MAAFLMVYLMVYWSLVLGLWPLTPQGFEVHIVNC